MSDRHFIAPLNSGLINVVKPFAIPNEAFAQLNNAYVWRERLRKRFGSVYMTPTTEYATGYKQLQSRLRFKVGVTVGGNMGATLLPLATADIKVGQMVSVGNEMYTLYDITGTTASFKKTDSATVTLDTVVRELQITGSATLADNVYYYPALPVMGLSTYEKGNINDFPTYAFDTRFVYQYDTTGWERITLGDSIWTGSNSDFFWAATWQGITDNAEILFVTNNVAADGIRYWDGITWVKPADPKFTYQAGKQIQTALMILPWKNRLWLFSTTEDGVLYFNRIRWCQNGSPLEDDAWRENIVGKGGFLDAPTQERIIAAVSLRDRIILYFEQSTWEMVYTENPVLPVVLQQLNSELGAQSTFSGVPFDIQNFAIGYTGVHQCNGVNVNRIDEKIPDFVFDISNVNNGTMRIQGIRDYFMEMVYWALPLSSKQSTTATIFPNAVLTYNYRSQSWGVNDDSITCFGYFRNKAAATWGNTTTPWEQLTVPWNSSTQTLRFRQVLAGNQEGYTFIIDPNSPTNSQVLQITNITWAASVATFTVINHNLREDDWLLIKDAQGDPVGIDNQSIQVKDADTADTFKVNDPQGLFNFTYLGGGTLGRITPIDILTKQYNFYQESGRNFLIDKVDFLIEKTSSGAITVDYYTNTSANLPLIPAAQATQSLVGTGTLETTPYTLVPMEKKQNQLWHTIYPQAQGNYIQLRFYLTDAQKASLSTALADFQVYAMCFTTRPTSMRLQ